MVLKKNVKKVGLGISGTKLPKDLEFAKKAAELRLLHLRTDNPMHLKQSIRMYDRAQAAAKKLGDKEAERVFRARSSKLRDIEKLLG